MMQLIREDIRARREYWFVVFSARMSHVWAIKPAEYGTIVLEPAAAGLLCDYVDAPIDEVLSAIKGEGNHVLSTESTFGGYTPRGLQTCVSVVKSLLGMRAWHIITPKQLYRHLLNTGATEI